MSLLSDTHKKKRARLLPAEVTDKKQNVLICSADLNFCFSLSMLYQDRYNVVTATDVSMLDTFAESYSADLVILDFPPSQKIIERLNALKALNRRVPVIMLYVYGSKEMELDKIIRSYVDSVFYKPFEIAAVSSRIEELLPAQG